MSGYITDKVQDKIQKRYDSVLT